MSRSDAAAPLFACGFFHDVEGRRLLLHLRDARAPVHPSMWGLFGGLAEGGESALQCFRREIREELGLDLEPWEPKLLRAYRNERRGTRRHVFVVERYVPEERIVLGEGAAFRWVPVHRVLDYDLTPGTREDLRWFLSVRRS